MESIIFYNMKNYTFIALPKNLSYYLDSYCLNILVRLINYSDYKQDTSFKISNEYLKDLTGYSKKIINATLSGLHRKGIITVDCVGIGQGKKQPSNTITINVSKFEEYDKIIPTIENLRNEDLMIKIDPYREKGWKVSYLSNNETPVETPSVEEETKPEIIETLKELCYKEDTETNIILNSVETPSVEEEIEINTAPLAPQKQMESLTADTATASEIVEDALKKGFTLTAIKDSTTRGFGLQNLSALNQMQSIYGYFSPELKTNMFKYCKEMKY